MSIPQVSIIATIYNAENFLEELVREISLSVEKVTADYEIILVEDCGMDNSWGKIEELGKKDTRIRGIKLSRNFGQQMAMSAGIRYAQADTVIIMDGDLQNPPEAIPSIIEKVKEGYDVVYTVSKTRNNFKDELTSWIFWSFINKVFNVGMVPDQLMMKGFSKRFKENFNSYEERIRVVAGITKDIGLNTTMLEVQNRKRKYGKSNYTFFKRFHLMVDIILAMTNAPLNYMINISLVSLLITLVAGVWNLISYIMYPDIPPGYTTLVILILFFGSLTLLTLGIIGRYLSNIYIEIRRRPVFIINKTINLPHE
ncbi:MAG TPA: glycosyltransferase family 2 protein [Bacteroidia bacterium]|jgi:glycosyltransferase involved in cell wall biosynthesis|nr:glycosyltransferase family 2 protein [Bacteroidia bacterium]